METRAIFDKLVAEFGDSVHDYKPAMVGVTEKTFKGDANRDDECKVNTDKFLDVMDRLRHDPELDFDFLMNVTAVDYIKTKTIQVVYHLFSYRHRHQFVVKVDLDRDAPKVPSVIKIWKTADWNEREQFDLFGVIFEGHGDLRRLLMPDDWVGHPMRKDYKEAEQYRGMPTSRYSPLEMLSVYDKAHIAVSTDPNVVGGKKPVQE